MNDRNRRREVVVTGLGVVSPIGIGLTGLLSGLSSARSGIAAVTVSPLLKTYPAGVVPQAFDADFKKLELPYLDRCQQMAIVAARQAIEDAGLQDFAAYGQRAGLFYGNVRGGASTSCDWHRQLLREEKQSARPFTAMALMQNAGAAHISIRHQILGPVITHGSACASSAVAAGDGLRAIRDGYLDVAVIGGAESALTAAEFSLFEGIRALAPADADDISRSCKPFAKNRGGLVFGEGAAFLVIESAEHARNRGAACYATFAGCGIAADGYHVGQPKAEGQIAAMQAALADAGLQPSDIGYLNAHATATRGGDSVEAHAIRSVFGDAAGDVRVSATKSVHGHLLGAASALELVITVVSMAASLIPATAHLDEIDPDCAALNHVANVPLTGCRTEHAMSFSCGFGGTNAALVMSRRTEADHAFRSIAAMHA